MHAWQEYDSLPAGNWTFAVMAADAAGNVEAQPQSAAPWQVDMAAFVQITGGDAGATITRQAQNAIGHAIAALWSLEHMPVVRPIPQGCPSLFEGHGYYCCL